MNTITRGIRGHLIMAHSVTPRNKVAIKRRCNYSQKRVSTDYEVIRMLECLKGHQTTERKMPYLPVKNDQIYYCVFMIPIIIYVESISFL